MSSAQQSALTLQQYNHVSLVMLSAVGYDYILTFSNEIEYIWNKPWTWVSTLFILVRYLGLFNLVIYSLVGGSFLPAPEKVCGITYAIAQWTFVLFLCAVNFMMILRVWAMYNRSTIILATLLAVFFLEIISMFVVFAIYSAKSLPTASIQILSFSSCELQPASLIVPKLASILQITYAAAMCILAIVQFVRQSRQMYRVTKQWQFNRYMSLLVRQGILYFIAVFLLNLINVLVVSGNFPTVGWAVIPLAILEYVPLFTLSPRFIMSIRELYARDVRGGRGGGIDTGFGLSLSSCNAAGTTIVFADVEQNEVLEDVEKVSMEVRTTQLE
ncbi:hypothetical protein OG21DRAFT_1500343 [Imleria badia]|nr:hypothetical protein OG21DRAFT_1500343 [Imleria badia]